MTTAGSSTTTSYAWRSLLPAGRTFVTLPSRDRPVVVAEHDSGVLDYVRGTLLARPPHSRVPGWGYTAARQMLRAPVAWRALPRLPRGSGPGDTPLAAWLVEAGQHVLVLDHSHDPDSRFVVLRFPPGGRAPTVALKVPTGPEAAIRIALERNRLQVLAAAPLAAIRDTLPRLVELPGGAGLSVLATTAKPGTPMHVACYRGRHARDRDAVRADFAMAGVWLAALQSVATGAPGRLDVAEHVIAAARTHLAAAAADVAAARAGLSALRHRLGRHYAARTVVHGDFWAGNILVHGSAVTGVVDWERADIAGCPIRDLARFATAYSLYLDRHTRPGRTVAGHPGLRAGTPGAGVRYALNGEEWYPTLARAFVADGLQRLGLPRSLARDVMLADVAAVAAEATEPRFRREQWQLFADLCRTNR